MVPHGGRGCRHDVASSPLRAGADARSIACSSGRARFSERSIAAQIAATLVLALSVAHNGWVWFQGGDQIWMTTTGWLLGQRDLPPTEIGYLWPAVQAPVTWATGPTYVQALPALVVAQVLVLGPVALLCVYGIASHIGGRLLGYWASLLWVVAPFAVIPLFVDRYHERWSEQFLPQALGLTAMADFPSMVLVARRRALRRALASPGRVTRCRARRRPDRRARRHSSRRTCSSPAVPCWRTSSHAAGAKGSRAARRSFPRSSSSCFWKVRGLGEIPAFALEQTRLAAGTRPLALDLKLDRYFQLDFDHWRMQMDSPARVLLERAARAVGAVRWPHRRRSRAPRRDRGVARGVARAFLVVKGFSERADIEANTFWRLLMPAWPAYLLLFASIPLLVPTLARRLGERVRRRSSSASVAPRWIAVAAVATVLHPRRRDRALVAARSRRRRHPSSRTSRAGTSSRPSTTASQFDVRARRLGSTTHVDERRSRGAPTSSTASIATTGRATTRVPPLRRRRLVLPAAQRADRDDARPLVRRRLRAADGDLPRGRRHELDRRPGGRGRLRLQPSGRRSRLSRSSSSAIRCARSTFSSVSREMTVE